MFLIEFPEVFERVFVSSTTFLVVVVITELFLPLLKKNKINPIISSNCKLFSSD